ncbi:MAG: invasion associated locus B family protein [Beijerinckiaceae bacterium]
MSNNKRFLTAVAFAAAIAGLASPTAAQQRPAARNGQGNFNALEIGKAGAWEIFTTGEGRSRNCFVRSKPAERLPKGLNRDPAYVYVTMRQGDANRQEFSVITGYGIKPGAEAQLAVGAVSFAGLGQNSNLWLKNPAEEGRFIAELRKATAFTVKGTSARGNETTDRYSLTGFGQALERAQKECS